MTAAELEKLLAEVDQDDFPTTRHNAKAELDKISVKLARRVIAAERIAEALRAWGEIAHHCEISDGSCCCGDDMARHAAPMICGHTPVDHGGYAASKVLEETVAALAAYEAAK